MSYAKMMAQAAQKAVAKEHTGQNWRTALPCVVCTGPLLTTEKGICAACEKRAARLKEALKEGRV